MPDSQHPALGLTRFVVSALVALLAAPSIALGVGSFVPAPDAVEVDLDTAVSPIGAIRLSPEFAGKFLADPVQAATEETEEEEEEDETLGFQLQLRAGWFHLAHNNRNRALAGGNEDNDGWTTGVALVFPLFEELGPIDLLGYLAIEYRQLGKSDDHNVNVTLGAVTGKSKGTISYLNIVWGPTIRIPVSEMIRPFISLAGNFSVNSPPNDSVTYLDLGATLGFGLDLKVHERLSFGLDYRYTWLGVADSERLDYCQLGCYVGFNF